jgi:hypothetical protein
MKPGITLSDGSFYPHSFTLDDLSVLARFIASHKRCITMAEFARGDRDPAAICVRHDVDHSIVQALRFAQWEADEGIRSTYFVLPSARYWTAEPTREIALQIQALGHEVGVHNDAHTFAHKSSAPDARNDPLYIATLAINILREQAELMRSWGLEIIGCADHGGGIPYNVDLWRAPLNHTPSEAGLEYEAYLLHHANTNYISDNRGTWRAPLEQVLGRPTHVLCHPEHWQLP